MASPQKNNDMELYIEIKNERPLELLDLTKSLISLGNQFNKFAFDNGYPEENRDTKLFIDKIENGSVLMTLYEISKPVLPLVTDTNTIVQFAGYLKGIIDFYKNGTGEKPVLKESDLKEVSSIINPIAKDNGSQLNITAKDNAQVFVTINTNSLEANAIQNRMSQEIVELKKINDGSSVEKEIFYWEQAKGDMSKDTGNRGIIEDVSKSAKRVIFENDDIKYRMLHDDKNPFLYFFVVDAKVEIIQDKPIAYKITHIHDMFLKDEEAQ